MSLLERSRVRLWVGVVMYNVYVCSITDLNFLRASRLSEAGRDASATLMLQGPSSRTTALLERFPSRLRDEREVFSESEIGSNKPFTPVFLGEAATLLSSFADAILELRWDRAESVLNFLCGDEAGDDEAPVAVNAGMMIQCIRTFVQILDQS